MNLKYLCTRCPNTHTIQVEEGDKFPKSIKCTIKECKGRMRLPRDIVVGAKNHGGRSFRRKPF